MALPTFDANIRARADYRTPNVGQTAKTPTGVADAIESAASFGMKVYNRVNEEAADEAYNDSVNQINEKQVGYLNTKMSGAKDAYGEYVNSVNEVQKNATSKLNGRQTEIYMKKMQTYRQRLDLEAKEHLVNEGRNQADFNLNNGVSVMVKTAMSNPTNHMWDDDVKEAISTQVKGKLSMEAIDSESEDGKAVYEAEFAQRYSSYAAQKSQYLSANVNGVTGWKYYEENKHLMTPNDKLKIEHGLKAKRDDDAAEGEAVALFMANPNNQSEALKKAAQIPNVDVRNKVYNGLVTRYQIQDRIRKTARQDIQTEFIALVTNGAAPGDERLEQLSQRITPEIDTLDNGQSLKSALSKWHVDYINGKFTTSDPKTVSNLTDMMVSNPSAFLSADISTNLSAADQLRFSKAKNALRQNEGKVLQDLQRGNSLMDAHLDQKLQAANLYRPERTAADKKFNQELKAKAKQRYREAYLNSIDSTLSESGRFTDASLQAEKKNLEMFDKQLDGFIAETKVERSGNRVKNVEFPKSLTGSIERTKSIGGGSGEALKGIPSWFQERAANELLKRQMPATPENILKMYEATRPKGK